MVIFVYVLGLLVLFFPSLLSDPENFIPANSLVTPAHIKPEFYFLWAYAILRSVPNKLGGVVAMVRAIIVLILVPLTSGKFISCRVSRANSCILWWFVVDFLGLTWIGSCPVGHPYTCIGAVFTIIYLRWLILDPLIKRSAFEQSMYCGQSCEESSDGEK